MSSCLQARIFTTHYLIGLEVKFLLLKITLVVPRDISVKKGNPEH